MTVPFEGLTHLERGVAAIATSVTPADAFHALIEGTGAAAPRASLHLVRGPAWKGWGCRGFPQGTGVSVRALSTPTGTSWLDDVAAAPHGSVVVTPAPGRAPRFGQVPSPEEVAGVPVHVADRCIAVLVAEHVLGEGPWHPPALAILAHATRLRLELDLSRRRLQAHDASRMGPTAASSTPEPMSVTTPPAGLTPWDEPPASPAEGEGANAAARRFARLVATDIRLYNEEAVVAGRRTRDLAQRLGEPMARGLESFERRFPQLGEAGRRILRDAYVQVLAGGDGSLVPDR